MPGFEWLTHRAGLGEGGRGLGATPLENGVRGLGVLSHGRCGISSYRLDALCGE